MADEYTCAICDNTYDKTWSDEESMAEMEQIFGQVPMEECNVVCDDCYKKMGF